MPKFEPDIEKVIAEKEVLRQENQDKQQTEEYGEMDSINQKVEHFLSNSLTDDTIDRLREAHPEAYRQVKDIKKYLVRLSELINQQDKDLVKNCHFNHRLGNFLGSSGFILRVARGTKIDEDSYKRILERLEDERNYFATCLADKDYLAKELNEEEGVTIQ